MHPLALLSLLVLIINDHLLKETYSNSFTGKISDFAGLVFFPLLLIALIEILYPLFNHSITQISGYTITRILLVVAIGYISIKSVQPFADLYSTILGVVELSAKALPKFVLGQPMGHFVPRRIIADPSDLIALPMLFVAWIIAGRVRSAQVGVDRYF